ncbi:hypothetical protein PILCRDRAFT_605648 [Piloderma croceum F 1598]|uniref:Uncharacterized protein n=1 Tax=Piloderma croceum (strain F 1598) TaxID=765440 RepID=A0A0C3BKP1_PILCF|nr:hypothetical protein PILCRDRAFT_605648 [Piloderma croceum F 1598]
MVSTRSASEIWHPAKGDPTLKFTKILAHNMPKGYPYRFGPRDKSNMIPYYEWRGKGPPPDDIGHPGDLYLDLTPGNYALHAHTTKKWVKWVGPRTKKEGLLAHPHLKDRYLDCSDRFIGWYAESTIRRHQAKLVVSCSASGSIQKLVALERGLNGHQQETTRRNGDSNSDDDDCEEDGGHVHAKQRHPKRRRVDSGSGESARESASSDEIPD